MAKEAPILTADDWFIGEDKTLIFYVTTGKPVIIDVAAAQGDTELTIRPLVEALVLGDKIRLGNDIVTLTASADVGDVTLSVSAISGSLPRGSVGYLVVDISGWTFTWVLRASSGGTVILSKSGSIQSAVNGVVEFTIADTDTDAMNSGTYYYAMRRTNDGSETVLAYGRAVLRRAA